VEAFFNFIKNWLLAVYTRVVEVIEWAIVKVATFLLDLVYWLMDTAVAAVVALADTLGVKSMIETAWASMPANTIAILDVLDVGFLIGVIIAAYAFRFVLRMVWK